MAHDYISLDALKAAAGDHRTSGDAVYQRAISAASRWIDSRCSTKTVPRHFWLADSASARVFRANARHQVIVGDFADLAGVTVQTDDNADGVFETTWTSDQWQAEPLVRPDGWPYREITTATRGREFPIDARRPRVRVTARWGWAAVPVEVEQACLTLAVAYVRSKDLTGAEIGFETDRRDPASPLALAEHLLTPFLPDQPQPGSAA